MSVLSKVKLSLGWGTFTGVLDFLAKSRKAVATAAGVALTALTFAGTFTPLLAQFVSPAVAVTASGVIGTAVAVLTPIVTWLVPNKK